ncbi:hypothetical protein ILUMI_25970 [Ignelater luminosus]|uniref:Uncharacterized protein n=1 Tax=Ignelater luminosus TaxID=2038154 RepID=A0A8K0C6I2_IGNLU|nr:hypothetical protein ILUMI_25970 [Ignelater luminosus]
MAVESARQSASAIDFIDKEIICVLILPHMLSTISGPDISVQEPLDIVLGDEQTNPVKQIFIAPLEPAVLTDEDSGNDDEGGGFNNLSRRQLLADADVRTVY